MNVVWFKRDLRVADHRALCEAAQSGDCLPIYIIEPEYWQQRDTSNRQWRFIAQSLQDLNAALLKLGQGLWLLEGDVISVFQWLHDKFTIDQIYAHQETGNHWTFQRDIAVKRWAQSNQLEFTEYPQFAVKRGPSSRDQWTNYWRSLMDVDCYCPPRNVSCPSVDGRAYFDVEKLDVVRGYDQSDCQAQKGGLLAGEAILENFLTQRGKYYRGGISKPAIAIQYCSRLSPYISYGCISLRHLVQTTLQAQKAYKGSAPWPASLAAFESRLHWHCHFIQKLEDQPSIETQCMHPGFEGMRAAEYDPDQERLFNAWASGQTGYPLVDACMRMLINTGWLNFRMRAMLVSFASFHLWLHWQRTAEHLARLFVDYEPGIHYSQIQMQSGTTGINPPRMYNPLKQSLEQDPEGVFIRRWCPEIAKLPKMFIHNPWLLTTYEQDEYDVKLGKDYPLPIADLEQAAKEARENYARWKHEHIDQADTLAVIRKHASRKRKYKTQKRLKSPQIDLFE